MGEGGRVGLVLPSVGSLPPKFLRHQLRAGYAWIDRDQMANSTHPSGVHHDEPNSGRRAGWLAKAGLHPEFVDFVVTAVAIVLFAVPTAFGLSGSSIPLLSESGAPDEEAIIIGVPRPIRSDEWLAWSPIKSGQAHAGLPDERVFGMGWIDTGNSWRHQVPSRSLGHVVYSPMNLPLLFLPPTQGFAGYWWLPFFAAFLGSYFWFRLLGSRWSIAVPASLLVVTAPAAVWWSGWPLIGIAHATVACALLMGATRRWRDHRVGAAAMILAAALAAAGLPWFYQPWAIVAFLFTGGVTAIWGLSTPGRRRDFFPVLVAFALLFVAESALYLWHEREYYVALADTVYPGARRAGGGGVRLGFLFSSLYAATVNGVDGSRIVGTNLSELSTGWSIALPIAVGIGVLVRREMAAEEERNLIRGTLVLAVILTSWTLVRWPKVFAVATLLVFVQPERLAPFVGFFGITGLVLLCGDRERWQRLRSGLDRGAIALLAALGLAIAAWTTTEFLVYLESLSRLSVVLVTSILVAVVVLLASGRAVSALWASAVISVSIAAFVNPLVAGRGAVDTSPAAEVIARLETTIAEPIRGTWAADDLMVVALLNGVGVNALSSFNDPVDAEGWRTLDPSGTYEDQWNRFAYIYFLWEPGLAEPVIEATYTDILAVRVDPCDPRLTALDLTLVVSSHALSGPCLIEEGTIVWQGVARQVFSRTR